MTIKDKIENVTDKILHKGGHQTHSGTTSSANVASGGSNPMTPEGRGYGASGGTTGNLDTTSGTNQTTDAGGLGRSERNTAPGAGAYSADAVNTQQHGTYSAPASNQTTTQPTGGNTGGTEGADLLTGTGDALPQTGGGLGANAAAGVADVERGMNDLTTEDRGTYSGSTGTGGAYATGGTTGDAAQQAVYSGGQQAVGTQYTEGSGGVIDSERFTKTEDHEVLIEKKQFELEHRPVQKQYVVETRFVGEKAVPGAPREYIGSETREVEERIKQMPAGDRTIVVENVDLPESEVARNTATTMGRETTTTGRDAATTEGGLSSGTGYGRDTSSTGYSRDTSGAAGYEGGSTGYEGGTDASARDDRVY